MNENTKTAVLVIIAAVVAVGVWLTKPGAIDTGAGIIEGTLLCPEFTDPLAATSLEVIKYDEQTSDLVPFSVAQVNNIWSIPSHENYPADAKDHLAAAAADLVDLKILSVADDNPARHGEFGVLDPTDKDLKPGTSGVGMKVVMKGKDDKPLVAMIIGKEDKNGPGLRYVRRAGQDAVVTVSLSTDKLTTDFGDWIEKDLLKLNAFDVREIYIQDYAIDEAQGMLEQRDRLTLAYDDAAQPPWKLALDQEFQDGKWTPVAMAADEEIDTAKLDDLKSSLDNLEIVDVVRKPAGLSADLAASKEFLDNREAAQSLAQRGFYLAQVGDQRALYSNEGEIRCLMKDGVEYVLRFGNIAGSGKAAAAEGEKAGDDDGGVNRYIFVMAEFNPSPIAAPKLEPLPDLPKADEKPADAKPEEAKADETTPPVGEEAKTDATGEPKHDEAKADNPGAGDKPTTDEEPKADDAKAQRERIEKENKRKQEEYDAQIAAGKKRVEELNARFADWYYVISEATYKKIHLGRKDIVKKKSPEKPQPGEDQPGAAAPAGVPEPGDHTPEAFDQLKQGLEPAQP